jgi:DeoR/GlpR family transcriptional regulator of sugar metabolism
MFILERQQRIIEIIKKRKCATVSYLSRELYASEATIRRDLVEMQKRNMIKRVRGGAALIEGISSDEPLLVRMNRDREKKEYIARLALRYVSNGATLFMDPSSTVTVLASHLGEYDGLTVLTNGVMSLNILNEKTTARVFCSGGLIRNNSALVGQSALDGISKFYADVLFFSCCGVSIACGSTEALEDNATVKRAMFENAAKRILLCDSTKFDTNYFCKVCDVNDIDVIITDKKPSDKFLENAKCAVIYK